MPAHEQPEPTVVKQPYGCDRCGLAKNAHEWDEQHHRLYCPNQGPHRFGTWSDSLRWIDDGHAVVAVLRLGNVQPRLVHPESGCRAVFCHCQGMEEIERDPDPDCPDCHGSGHDPDIPCWLDHVLGEMGFEFWEQTRWRPDLALTEPVPILYSGGWDDFEWRPRSA